MGELRYLPICRSCYVGFEGGAGTAWPRVVSVRPGARCPGCRRVAVSGLMFAPVSGRKPRVASGDRLKLLEG